MGTTRGRILHAGAAVVVGACCLGCAASTPYRPLDAVPGLDARPVEVVPVPRVPEAAFQVFAKSGIGGWGKGCLGGGVVGACCGLELGAGTGRWEGVAIGVPLGAAVGGVVGGLEGAKGGRTVAGLSQEIRGAEHALRRTLRDFDVAGSVAESLRESLSAAQTGPMSRAADNPVVLDVTPTRVYLDGTVAENPRLCLVATVRVFLPLENREVHSEEFLHEGPPHALRTWRDELVRAELTTGCRELGREVVDSLFLPAELPLIPSQFYVGPSCGLSAFSEAIRTDTAPKLSWVSFPRQADVEATPGLARRVSDVRYDLRVWEAAGDRRGGLVYEKDGLLETSHLVEGQLVPGMKYLWTVRARFLLDGKRRAIPWSALPDREMAVFSRVACDSRGQVTGKYPSFVTPSR